MEKLIEDKIIDNLEVVWVPTPLPGKTRLKNSSPDLGPINNFFSWWQWKDIPFFIDGVLEHSGRSVNDLGFAYPEEIDEDDEKIENSVQFFDNFSKIYLSEEAFQRLMLGFFKTLYNEAKAGGLSIMKEPLWQDFVSKLEQLEQKLES